jgi:hypothetical protein
LRPQLTSFASGNNKSLDLDKKFHNNANVPDIFKNSKTDDYVSSLRPRYYYPLRR